MRAEATLPTRWGARWGEVHAAAVRPVSSASLAVFRIAFGVAMVVNSALYVPVLVREYYLEPDVLFPYPPLEWVAPPPGAGLYGVFAVQIAAAALVAVGRWTRPATITFLVTSTYVFLLDSTYYQNHEYLISLLALMLAVLPAGCRWSLDARRHPERRSATVPAWVVWVLRFQVGVPYVYGGLAKLNPDWLLRAEPLRMWIARRTDIGPIDAVLTNTGVVWTMAYGALVLDLVVVALLLHRRTRLPAYVVVTGFHLLNAWLFGLFIFPWLMIAATTVFFDPDWPERLAARWSDRDRSPAPAPTPAAAPRAAWRPSAAVVALFAVWVVVQLALPLRHLALAGDPSWTEEAHRFAWHMKLRDKVGTVEFVVTTPDGTTTRVDPAEQLGDKQAARLPGSPQRLVQMAHHLSDQHGGAEVRAETSVSLNGREPRPMVDPTVDLSALSTTWWGPAPWIAPLDPPSEDHDDDA